MTEITMSVEFSEDIHRFLKDGVLRSAPDWGFVVTSFFLTTLATLFCLGSAIFLVWHRNNSIISLSQPRFLGVAFLASTLVSASGYFLVGAHLGGTSNKSDQRLTVVCSLCIWGFVLGHNIVYMALFGKLWRIQKVCRIRRHQTVTVQQTIWPLRVMVSINLCILIAWVVVDPPKYVELEKADGLVGTCDFVQLPFLIPIQILLMVSAFLGLWMTYKTKNLPGDLNDGGHIAFVYVGNMVAMVVCGSLYWAGFSLEDPTLVNFGISLALFMTPVTTVAPIALPKMYYVWYQKKHNKLPEGLGAIGHGQVHVSQRPTGRTSITNGNRRSSIEKTALPMGSPDLKEAEPAEASENFTTEEEPTTSPNGDE